MSAESTTDDQRASVEVQRLVRRFYRQQKIAGKKLITWSAVKPTRRGVWLGAKRQKSGYYHIQRYTGETCKYLQAQPDEYWSGPYESSEEWMRYVSPPNDPKLSDAAHKPHKPNTI